MKTRSTSRTRSVALRYVVIRWLCSPSRQAMTADAIETNSAITEIVSAACTSSPQVLDTLLCGDEELVVLREPVTLAVQRLQQSLQDGFPDVGPPRVVHHQEQLFGARSGEIRYDVLDGADQLGAETLIEFDSALPQSAFVRVVRVLWVLDLEDQSLHGTVVQQSGPQVGAVALTARSTFYGEVFQEQPIDGFQQHRDGDPYRCAVLDLNPPELAAGSN